MKQKKKVVYFPSIVHTTQRDEPQNNIDKNRYNHDSLCKRPETHTHTAHHIPHTQSNQNYIEVGSNHIPKTPQDQSLNFKYPFSTPVRSTIYDCRK